MHRQLSLLELLERPTLDALFKPDEIFASEDGNFIARLSEDTRFDRKSGRVEPMVLAQCLSGFGNGPAIEGGVVAVGIEKDGRISGCKSLNEKKIQEIESAGRDSCPDGKFQTRKVAVVNSRGENDFIILIRIFYVENRLVSLTNGEAYVRQSDKCRKVTPAEREEIRISKGERSFELEPCGLEFPDDFRRNDVAAFVNRIRAERGASLELTEEKILQSMRLGQMAKDGKFVANNVCALMFAEDCRRVFPGAYVHFLRYQGTEIGSGSAFNVIKDRIVEGTVLDVIKDTASILDANLREFTAYRNGKFHTVPEYPRDAWYEILVNACVHRSYHAKTVPIFVRMFDDRLVVESPGAFMPSVTPENLFHKPRNPFLMFALREYGEVRCISEGTARIKREMNEAKLPAPIFRGTETSVTVALHNEAANRTNSLDTEAYRVLGETISFTLDADEKKIINYVIEHKRINVSDALRILSTTYWHTAKAKLMRLVQRDILMHHATKHRDPNAFYELKRKTSLPPGGA